MLDIKLLREEPEKVKKGIKAKNFDPRIVDEFLKLDEEWRELTAALDGKRAEQKKLSGKIAAPKGGEPRPEALSGREEAKKNKEEIKTGENKLADIEKQRDIIWRRIPNLPSDDTPIGNDESGNKVLRKDGTEPRKFDFEPKDHLALGESLGMIDVRMASKVSGARFSYLKGDAAMLEFAIVNYALEFLTNGKILESVADGVKPGYNPKPFIPVVPPAMIRPEVFDRMARLEPREERYRFADDDLYLIGSAEHTLGPLHMDETIPEEKLPIRYVGFSTAFRREAGSYGKDMQGILRVHQFDKIEIESFTVPEDSRTEQDFIVSLQENLMWALELPYQVVQICTGDMGGPNLRQIDIETWMPGQGKYRETHTSDLNGDYQSRRLGTRVKRKDPSNALLRPSSGQVGAGGKTEFVHMNDATVFAIGRILIAIMENYQTKDGKIEIPKVLQKYMGKKMIG